MFPDWWSYMVINSLRGISYTAPCFIYGTCVGGVRCQPRSTPRQEAVVSLVSHLQQPWGDCQLSDNQAFRCWWHHMAPTTLIFIGGLSRWDRQSVNRCSVWNINSMNLWTSDLIGFITISDRCDLWDRWCLMGKNWQERFVGWIKKSWSASRPWICWIDFAGYRITH